MWPRRLARRRAAWRSDQHVPSREIARDLLPLQSAPRRRLGVCPAPGPIADSRPSSRRSLAALPTPPPHRPPRTALPSQPLGRLSSAALSLLLPVSVGARAAPQRGQAGGRALQTPRLVPAEAEGRDRGRRADWRCAAGSATPQPQLPLLLPTYRGLHSRVRRAASAASARLPPWTACVTYTTGPCTGCNGCDGCSGCGGCGGCNVCDLRSASAPACTPARCLAACGDPRSNLLRARRCSPVLQPTRTHHVID